MGFQVSWDWVHFMLLSISTGINFIILHNGNPDPYMDEVFHIPQAQRYCQYNFTWDPKITTLPGLYVFSTLLINQVSGIHKFLGSELDFCIPVGLRGLNVGICFGIFWVLYDLIQNKCPGISSKRRAFLAYTLTIFPVSYFFTFFYYTDQLSTWSVLLMIRFMAKGLYGRSAIAGFAAVFTRQTNIIWVGWIALWITWTTISDDLVPLVKKGVKYIREGDTGEPKSLVPSPSDKKSNRSNRINRKSTAKQKDYNSFLLESYTFWRHSVIVLAPKLIPFIIIMFGFVLFVFLNNGIVVGDRSAHKAVINLPQMFYFTLLTGVMLVSHLLCDLVSTLKFILTHIRLYLSLVGLSLLIVKFNTIAHPYLLADNRHYTFYIWKRLYMWIPWMKFALVPGYILVWFWLWNSWKGLKDTSSKVLLIMCIGMNLVPQSLLEFRYFIIPFYLSRLEMIPSTSSRNWIPEALECLIYFSINIFTFYMFITKPFEWSHEPGQIQRFMW